MTEDKPDPLAEAQAERDKAQTELSDLRVKLGQIRAYAESAAAVARHSTELADVGRMAGYLDVARKLERI